MLLACNQVERFNRLDYSIMKFAVAIALGVAIGTLGIQVPRKRTSEPFAIYASLIKVEGARWDPDPIWVKIRWKEACEAPFRRIRKGVYAANQAPLDSDKSGLWARKSRAAYSDWYQNHQNAEKLFKVASYLATTANLDISFAKSKDFKNMDEHVNLGFSVLRAENIPPSYEFCRRAYMVKAGDTLLHRFRDLAVRLLKRSPVDRGVALTMVKEYRRCGPDAVYEKAMFGALDAASKAPGWRYWDEHWIAHAWRYHAWHHNQKSSYDKAIAFLDKAIAQTPKGVDPAPMKTMRATFVRERELPHFGVPQFPKKKGGST